MDEELTFEELWQERLLSKMDSLDRERKGLSKDDFFDMQLEREKLSNESRSIDIRKEVDLAKTEAEKIIAETRSEIELTKIESDQSIAEARNEVERAKIEAEVEAEKTRTELEDARLKHDSKIAKVKAILEGCGIVVAVIGLVHAFLSLFMKDKHLTILNDWNESGNAAITAAQKFAVNDALKDERPWKF